MRRSTGGSILILALWVLFFLAALTVASAGHVWAVLQAAERLQSRALARMTAGSAAAWAVAQIEKETSGDVPVTNRWDGVSADAWNRAPGRFALPTALLQAGREGSVYFMIPDEEDPFTGVIGEEGRLHLRPENRYRIKALFEYLEAGSGERVLLFPDTEPEDAELTGGQGAGYDRATYMSVEDLLLVDGMHAALFEKVAPHLTVYGSGDIINVNSASHAVLVAVLVATDEIEMAEAKRIADEIVAARGERGFSGEADFRARLPDLARLLRRGLGFYSTAFRGIASGRGTGIGENGLEIVFVWDTISGQYVLWRER